MVQADQGSARPFTRTRWWWIRHAPVRAHGGRVYGQAGLACGCRDEGVLPRGARVLAQRGGRGGARPRGPARGAAAGAAPPPPPPPPPRHTAEALWACGYLQENEAAPP